MNFTLYEVDKPNRLKKLSSHKVNFFKKQDDIALYHVNEIKQDMFHLVYHLKDEYFVGTRRVGSQLKLPFNQFINCFFFLKNNSFLLEEAPSEYQEDIKDHIIEKTNVSIEKQILENTHFKKVYYNFSGVIKKIEYIDAEDNDYYLDSISGEHFNDIVENYTIDRITLLIDEQFLSVYRNGRVSVDNSNESFLIKFTREIVDAISYNN